VRLIKIIKAHPRSWLIFCAIIPLILLLIGLYLQNFVGLIPCPMCIVQRYILIIVMLSSALAACHKSVNWQKVWIVIWLLFSVFGAYVAAHQSWLQWYPPLEVSCGRDFYGIVETFPLHRAIPMIFRGGGDCSQVDWTFLGGSIANWSFVAFNMLALLSLFTLKITNAPSHKSRQDSAN